MPHFALFGSPLTQSLSPVIYQAFACSLAVKLTYKKIETQAGQLKQYLARFRAQGGIGANITLPLKEEAFRLCTHHCARAIVAKSVNTLYWQDDELWGDNTDGDGLVQDLTLNLGLNLAGKRILILGAGGATRGILFPLLERSVQNIIIVNRTLSRAHILARQEIRLKAYTYEEINNLNFDHELPFDLVINATSMSLTGSVPPLAERWLQGVIALDLAYTPKHNTVFMCWAQENGALAIYDGIGMLVEQAALSFARWFHKTPATRGLIHRLRDHSA